MYLLFAVSDMWTWREIWWQKGNGKRSRRNAKKDTRKPSRRWDRNTIFLNESENGANINYYFIYKDNIVLSFWWMVKNCLHARGWVDLISTFRRYQNLPLFKRGSRHAVDAAKTFQWRVDQLLKCLIKKITFSS